MKNLLIASAALLAIAIARAPAQDKTQSAWSSIGQNAADQRYSTLNQINRKNVSQLHVAWTYDTGLKGGSFEATPLFVKGVLYVTTPKDELIALDATTGKQLWKYDTGEPNVRTSRGVSYWPGDRKNQPRIIMGTAGGLLIELDAESGAPVDTFGDHGVIHIVEPPAEAAGLRSGFSETSPPAIYKNIAIMAPGTQEGPSRGETGNGDPRAFDILTGKQLWRFHSMPREGEFGSDTWGEPDGWKDRSGPSAWVPITVDEQRGIAYVATGNPADSYYGADRKGTNLYANCILALDATTGKLLWYFQMVHHDLWDGDASGTVLFDVHRSGKTVPGIAGFTKSGMMFILDRTTGKPIYGVEERPVAASDVPGEATWPTQPFSIKPPPIARQSMTAADLTTMTAPSEQACATAWATAHNSGPYTPLSLTPTVAFPSAVGAANWGGAAYDPKSGYVFINTSNLGVLSYMTSSANQGARGNRGGGRGNGGPDQQNAGGAPPNGGPPNGAPGRGFGPPNLAPPMPYRNAAATSRFIGPDGFPCQQPPWGLLTAVNVNTGDFAWQVPLGNYNDLDAADSNASAPTNSAASAAKKPDTGTPNIGSTMVTAGGLVFFGGTLDNTFRAFDSETGKVLWEGKLDGVGYSGPMTYMGSNGKQFVVIDVGGPGNLRAVHNHATESPEEIVAFDLQ